MSNSPTFWHDLGAAFATMRDALIDAGVALGMLADPVEIERRRRIARHLARRDRRQKRRRKARAT